jgi:hypothetical protein
LFYDLGLKKVPLKKSELKKGRRGGRGRRQEEGFSLFFREEYPLRDARILYEKKGREKGKETEEGRILPMNQVYIRLSPRTRLNNASSSSSSFRFLSLSLSVKIRERERD